MSSNGRPTGSPFSHRLTVACSTPKRSPNTAWLSLRASRRDFIFKPISAFMPPRIIPLWRSDLYIREDTPLALAIHFVYVSRMSENMTPARYIRERIFGVTSQTEFARLLGYEQPSISRFESGLPLSRSAQERIRRLAAKRRITWDNNWFFEVPRDAPLGGKPARAARAAA